MVSRALAQRASKVYIDCGQNRAGQTIAAPFSVRARPAAPVSMPLRPHELAPRNSNERFTIKNALRRLRQLDAEPMLPLLADEPDLSSAVRRLDHLIAGTDTD